MTQKAEVITAYLNEQLQDGRVWPTLVRTIIFLKAVNLYLNERTSMGVHGLLSCGLLFGIFQSDNLFAYSYLFYTFCSSVFLK